MGGLSKKGFQFEKIRKESGEPIITLDAGALLFKSTRLMLNQENQQKTTATGIVKAYNLIGYDAVGIGMRDLAAGLDFLKELAALSTFNWLSSNLVNKSSLEPIFKSHIILEAGSIKIGVIGLTNPQGQTLLATSPEVKLLPWQNTLPTLLPSLAQQTDLIILLSNLPTKQNQAISHKYPEINIILQAGTSRSNVRPKYFHKTIVTQTEKQGKYIGILNINWQPSGTWPDLTPQLLKQKNQELERLNWQLHKYSETSQPLKNQQMDPARLRTYQRLQTRQADLLQEIKKLEATINQNQGEKGDPSTFTNKFMAMRINMPDQKEVLSIVQEINRQNAILGKKQSKRKATSNTLYVGYRKCQVCHAEEVTSWRKTKHAKAYDTLVRNKKQYDLQCLPCHVTGVSLQKANAALKINSDLRNVGCEVCHGPGKNHSASPESNKMISIPQKSVCLTCHTAQRDNTFNYQLDSKLVHP